MEWLLAHALHNTEPISADLLVPRLDFGEASKRVSTISTLATLSFHESDMIDCVILDLRLYQDQITLLRLSTLTLSWVRFALRPMSYWSELLMQWNSPKVMMPLMKNGDLGNKVSKLGFVGGHGVHPAHPGSPQMCARISSSWK